MRKITKLDLQVSCARKRWTIAIDNHRNILVSYSRYPLEGSLDLGDFSSADFEKLAVFFGQRKVNSKFTSANNKWSFMFNHHHCLAIHFSHHPFDGILELGEVSKEESELLLELFVKAKCV